MVRVTQCSQQRGLQQQQFISSCSWFELKASVLGPYMQLRTMNAFVVCFHREPIGCRCGNMRVLPARPRIWTECAATSSHIHIYIYNMQGVRRITIKRSNMSTLYKAPGLRTSHFLHDSVLNTFIFFQDTWHEGWKSLGSATSYPGWNKRNVPRVHGIRYYCPRPTERNSVSTPSQNNTALNPRTCVLRREDVVPLLARPGQTEG